MPNFDLIVIGGGPAGYAAAIRAGQLKKRVLCVEKENLGGTCLNWGCIPTKALLDAGAFVRRLRNHASEWGVAFDNLRVDFAKIVGRSRQIADRLSKGIAHLFRKYDVKHEAASAQLLAPGKVAVNGPDGSKQVTAANILIATGAKPRTLPGVELDGQRIISSREAMVLPRLPRRLAIIGAGAIGCEFADFYNAMGSEVTLVEIMGHILPSEDEDCSILLERLLARAGIKVLTRTRVGNVQKADSGVRLALTGPRGDQTVEADVVLLAVGVTGNLDGLLADGVNLAVEKGHIKVDLANYRTSLDGVYAVGDVIGPPWLAHVAHHEAIACVDRMFGQPVEAIDYRFIPGCTYTHPQVASLGLTEKKARDQKRDIRVGKFPLSASGRALAAGESDGFVKLIFDARYGELLGAHMIGEGVTELLSELVLARDLEATEEEIIAAMHPHPTLSEAVMEAAGVAAGRAIHL
jgi:dihydrolipoamide dehydrogenase